MASLSRNLYKFQKIGHEYSTDLQGIHVKEGDTTNPNGLWKVEVNERFIVETLKYEDQEFLRRDILNETDLTPKFFYILPSACNKVNRLGKILRYHLVEEFGFEYLENRIMVLAEEFKCHMMMCDVEKKQQSIVLVMQLLTRAVHKLKLICKLSSVEFRKGCFGTSTTCPICFDDFTDGMKVVKTMCEHIFHDSCLGIWLDKNERNGCPMCRTFI